MTSHIIGDWVEEGFSSLEETGKRVYRRASTEIPQLISKDEIDETPRPLFPIFLEEIDFESDFLTECLNAIEFVLREQDSKDTKTAPALSRMRADAYIVTPDSGKVSVEFHRKNIFLEETDTISFFNMPDWSVTQSSIEYEKVLQRNTFYQSALNRRFNYPQYYRGRSVQTIDPEQAHKEIETIPTLMEDKQCFVNSFLMSELYDQKEDTVLDEPLSFQAFLASKILFFDYEGFLSVLDRNLTLQARFKRSLYVVEKALDYNTYKRTILAYSDSETLEGSVIARSEPSYSNTPSPVADNLGDQPEEKEVKIPLLKLHMSFKQERVRNKYSVTWIVFNPRNPNIFISSYSVPANFETSHVCRGYILCWNIKKCGHPERIYPTREIVTCLDFSESNPFQFAAGMRYGLVALYDLRRCSDHPEIDNYESKYRPVGEIKSVRWLRKRYARNELDEVLMSISVDGIINCWKAGRGLQGYVLRNIKRSVDVTEEKERRMLLAVNVAGLCMSVKPDDSSIYLVGTIEGQVLHADVNDPENYLHVYNCHNGPIHDVEWSPTVKDVFATCSIDHCIKFWEVKRKYPSKKIFTPEKEAVVRISWSNVSSTLFAAVTESKLLVYDFSVNLYLPIIELVPTGVNPYTYVSFCSGNNWFMTGRSNGTVDMYEVVNIINVHEHQESSLKEAFLAEI